MQKNIPHVLSKKQAPAECADCTILLKMLRKRKMPQRGVEESPANML